jgi:hypothetical protein
MRSREREREVHKEGRVVPSGVKLREGPINVTELHWAKPIMGEDYLSYHQPAYVAYVGPSASSYISCHCTVAVCTTRSALCSTWLPAAPIHILLC